MDARRALLKHFLATIAYRTQKALRGAPDSFADFRAGINLRTPHEIIWHMTGVLGYARTFFQAGVWQPDCLDDFRDEVGRFPSCSKTSAPYWSQKLRATEFPRSNCCRGH
jgi:hypothetical protein